jgi:transcriptional regulator with XRE-family HTH domain
MTDEKTLGAAISAGRKKLNLSQKQLAERLTISPQYLNDIEHDRRSPSSDHMIQQFAQELGLSADWLYYLAGKMPDDVRRAKLDAKQVARGFAAFRREKG